MALVPRTGSYLPCKAFSFPNTLLLLSTNRFFPSPFHPRRSSLPFPSNPGRFRSLKPGTPPPPPESEPPPEPNNLRGMYSLFCVSFDSIPFKGSQFSFAMEIFYLKLELHSGIGTWVARFWFSTELVGLNSVRAPYDSVFLVLKLIFYFI